MSQQATVSMVLELRSVITDLVSDGRMSQEDANVLLGANRTRKQSTMHPLAYIASQNVDDALHPGKLLDGEALTHWMADRAQLPVVHIDPLKIDVSKVTSVVSYAFAKRHGILCVGVTPDEVEIACAQPFIEGWEPQVEHVARRRVKKVFANPADVERYQIEFYTLARSVSGATGGKNSVVTNFEQLVELKSLGDPEADDKHVVNIVDWLLQYAYDQRASDIHVEPRREVGRVRFRIDGVLHDVYEFPASVAMAVVSRFKVLGRMNIAEKRKPQDGRIKTRRADESEVELRLSTLPTAFGEKLVMRIFDPEVLLRSFHDLGLVGDDFKRWDGMLSRPNGIVLVTGPTGSGKTTTLYSSLRKLATSEVNVSTIEDPIEMVEESFNQTQVHHKIELDFAAGIRTLMRQDPDIIMVGEMRDLETAQMAVQAALTGHLVLSTLHTNDAPASIARLLDLGIPAYLINATLLGVMAQRLVRTLCPHCKEEGEIKREDWESLVSPWKVNIPEKVYRPVGCLECRNTGYLGRQGIYEILMLSDTVQDMITEKCNLQALRKQAMREGMRTLRLSGAQKIAAGLTTMEEVLRVAPPPERRER
ncbi:type II/IV secretion system protein [Gilvimarinus agarilyticus]|uniref:GspE/PulE family protein n=1 Tax=Gilvimarinus sp. 2_MG-2023 TaxID=3062666 RepID=UPI001C09519A|nr:type II/IV secretion system protein [Gilvimarinus sp. 2_MG-2023]MBU2886601.1 type II/IV secretion system protein [Gilvimarinus agarilyticus]MDO6571269.1 type II/IV secretion system protein [Gilvimarinus sp. 2_MG-2023]